MAEKRKFNIEYFRMMSQKMQQIPAWRDFADACQDVLGQSIDERRRRLEKIKDSVKYRRGDTLVDTRYKPQNGKIARFKETGIAASLPENILIPTARVRNVVKNIAYYGHPDTTDYLELEFTYKNQVYLWLKAVQLPQERDALLKNAYIMGFDFFNTKLSDEDLQRLYEFIQIYWNESGTSDNYIKFIGFIKNTRIELVNLWSYDDDTDNFPELEPRTNLTVPAYEGGKHYLTNHVELKIDLAQFGNYYNVNLNDLETLFYYFAPIIVVLDRISLYLDFPETLIQILSGAQEVVSAFSHEDFVFEFNTNILLLTSAQQTITFFSKDK